MGKGIIYIMKTAVNGLIKIGQTGSESFEQRMYILERNGYCNVTALERVFAIEVEDYEAKEILLHTIFAKSQVGNTELFALDINIAIQLLSSFEGKVIFPKKEDKEEIFEEATENRISQIIPDGEYLFNIKKKDENNSIHAKAKVSDGAWTLLKGSRISLIDKKSISQRAKDIRASLMLDDKGALIEDFKLDNCSPSFAGNVVSGSSVDGWTYWTDKNQRPIDYYRQLKTHNKH